MAGHPGSRALSAAELALLRACPPLTELTSTAREEVLAACDVVEFSAATTIFEQDELGEAFYVVLEGAVEVLRIQAGREVRLAELEAGAYFGEQALLGASLGRRNATARASRDCVCAEIGAGIFRARIAQAGRNREMFERDAAHHAYNRLRKSLEAFASNLLDESAEGVKKVMIPAGETFIEEGEPSDAAYLIVAGLATVEQVRGETRRQLSRITVGQVIGELGVLQDQPRTATVTAETELTALRIEAPAFRTWHAAHPGSTQFFDSLAEIYKLPESRRLCVFLGDADGHQAVTTVCGDPTNGVVSTRILDRGVVVFANTAGDGLEGDRETLDYSDGSLKRELRIIVKSRQQGRIETCVLHGVAAEGIEADLGDLYHRVVRLDTLTALDLRRFVRTGYLGGDAHARSKGLEGKICPCLGIGESEMGAAMEELGTNYETLRTAIGVGTLCGGCEPAGRSFVARSAAPKVAIAEPVAALISPVGTAAANVHDRAPSACPHAPPAAAPTDGPPLPPSASGYPLHRIQNLLATWSPGGDGCVRREDVALRFRGLGVRNMDQFLDTLFPGALPPHQAVSLTTLLEKITRTMDFDEARGRHGPSYASRVKSSGPVAKGIRRREQGVRFLLRHRHTVLGLAAMFFIFVAGGALYLARSAGAAAVATVLATEAIFTAALWRSAGVRYVYFILLRGESRIYSAMSSAFGGVTTYATVRPLGLFGPRVFYVRSEAMVERVLNDPRVFVRDSRYPLDTYPPFGVKSLLWGGVDGYWLGYRNLCEEYFVSGYEADLPEMAEIVRERVRTWQARGEIDLLKEIYHIVLEIRARIFFQTTFHCFDDHAPLDFAALIDRVLSGKGFFFVESSDADAVHQRVMEAVRGATRAGSVGHALRLCLESGDLEESEVLHNAVMYVLAQAPTMALFWTLYRAARTRTTAALRGERPAMVRAIKEEMRLHPPVTSLFFRTAARDAIVDGVEIAAGSHIFVCPLLIQTNPALWTDPERFDTNRWTSSAGVAREIVDPRTDAADSRTRPCPSGKTSTTSTAAADKSSSRHLPFGDGPHACQGRWFAADEMLLVVENVLDLVDLEVLEDHALLDRDLGDQVTLHVYSRPSNEVRLRVVPWSKHNR